MLVDVELLVDVLVGRYKRQVSAPDHVNNPHGRYTRNAIALQAYGPSGLPVRDSCMLYWLLAAPPHWVNGPTSVLRAVVKALQKLVAASGRAFMAQRQLFRCAATLGQMGAAVRERADGLNGPILVIGGLDTGKDTGDAEDTR